jgi:hypothetical protein
LAVSNGIKGLAATLADFRFLDASAPKFSRVGTALASAERSRSDHPPRSTRKPSPKFNGKLPPFLFFRKENVAAVRWAARTILRSGERLSATSAKAPRRPGRALSV